MQAKAIAVAAVLGVAALSWSSPAANAATCVRNSVFDDVGGHRTLIRSDTRCAIAPRYVHRVPRRTVTTTRTVIRDDYITTSRPYTTTVTRDYYSVPVREWDEDIYYGSSYAEPMRYYGSMGY
jgi:hypothetical protein